MIKLYGTDKTRTINETYLRYVCQQEPEDGYKKEEAMKDAEIGHTFFYEKYN